MTEHTAILVGATGLVGRHCLENLLADPAYSQVVVLVRRPFDRKHPKLEVRVIDFTNTDDLTANLKGDHFFCSLGTTRKQVGSRAAFRAVDYDLTLSLFKIAAANGVQRSVLISSCGAGKHVPLWYCRLKARLEAAIAPLPFKATYLLRPSLLLGQREQSRLGETIGKIIMGAFFFIYFGPLRKYKPIHAQAVADAMTLVAKRDVTGVHLLESDDIQDEADSLINTLPPQGNKATA